MSAGVAYELSEHVCPSTAHFTLMKANGNGLFIVFLFHVHMVGLFMHFSSEKPSHLLMSFEGFVAIQCDPYLAGHPNPPWKHINNEFEP